MSVRVQVAEGRDVADGGRFGVLGGSLLSLREEKRRIFPCHWPLLFILLVIVMVLVLVLVLMLHLIVVQILHSPRIVKVRPNRTQFSQSVSHTNENL